MLRIISFLVLMKNFDVTVKFGIRDGVPYMEDVEMDEEDFDFDLSEFE